MSAKQEALIGLIMGSKSDWKILKLTSDTLESLEIPHEVQVVSAHRTPDLLYDYASSAEQKGLQLIIAGAGGAAHLPGMIAAKTLLPVIGVPIKSKAFGGMDSLLSIVQMPAGIPVGTVAVGKAGAINAALYAAAILARQSHKIREVLEQFRQKQTHAVLNNLDPRKKES